ncbi:hypothetical protein RUM43_001385, partial [Polyplax serrata]
RVRLPSASNFVLLLNEFPLCEGSLGRITMSRNSQIAVCPVDDIETEFMREAESKWRAK